MAIKLHRIILALLLCTLLTGTGWAQEAKILNVGMDVSDMGTADPHFASGTPDRGLVDMVFNGLVRYKPGDSSVFEPDLATHWESSEGGRVWTFHLRQGVMCHPWGGNPSYELTSEDVVYSLQKSADPSRSAYAAAYDGMTFEAVDRYTVVIRSEQPVSEAIMLGKVANLSGGFIVCKQAVEDLGLEGFKTHPVGTGPFIFERYIPQQMVVLRKNPEYFRGEPKLDRVVLHYVPNIAAREAGLRTGELDLIGGLPEQPWMDHMRRTSNAVLAAFGPDAAVLHLNASHPPLDQLKVRQAIAYCIDREELRATLGFDVTEPLYSPIPPALIGGMTEEEVKAKGLDYPVDREKARQLLAEAGVEGWSPVIFVSERPLILTPMQNIQAQLNQCGIYPKLQVVDHATWHALIRENASPLVLYVAVRPDADTMLTLFYHSDSVVVTGARPNTNFSHIGAVDLNGDGQVDSIDDLIEGARMAGDDRDRQIQLWKEAQERILEWMVAYPLYSPLTTAAWNPNVELGYELRSVMSLHPPITELTDKK